MVYRCYGLRKNLDFSSILAFNNDKISCQPAYSTFDAMNGGKASAWLECFGERLLFALLPFQWQYKQTKKACCKGDNRQNDAAPADAEV
jgi:hypothetical protein